MHAAFSSHPVAAHAAGECIGALLDAGVESPDVALLVLTRESAAHLGEIAHLLEITLSPRTLIGGAFPGVFAGSDRAVGAPGVAMIAWSPIRAGRSCSGEGGPVARSLHVPDIDELREIFEADPSWSSSSVLVFADPFSVPLSAWSRSAPPGLRRVVGGYASGATRPGGSSLLHGREVRHEGLVVLRVDAPMDLVASSRSIPVGPVRTITAAEADVLLELDGVPALELCESLLSDLGVELDAPSALRCGVLSLSPAEDSVEDVADPNPFRRVWAEPGTGALRCDRSVDRGEQLVLALSDTEAAVADIGQRLAPVGWPTAADAVLAVADLAGADLVDDAVVIAANSSQAPAVGIITEGVLTVGRSGPRISSDVLTLGVLRGHRSGAVDRFSGL